MKTFRSVGRPALGAGLVILLFSAVQSEAAVRFVASNGNNANPCTRAAPCRTLQRGVDAAAAGDEVQVLDSGEYGPSLNIDKSITISAVGVTARLTKTTAGGPVILISASGDRIVLRGLRLNSLNMSSGIVVDSAASVFIDDCTIERMNPFGIALDASAEVFITDTIVRDNTSHGIALSGLGSTPVVIDNSRVEFNGGNGIVFDDVNATITRTTVFGNSGSGILQHDGTSTIVSTTSANNGAHGFAVTTGGKMTLEHAVARGHNAHGLHVEVSAEAWMSNSVLTNNFEGYDNFGVINTRGNNTIVGNQFDTNGNALVPLPPT